jgi:hypothetical protein
MILMHLTWRPAHQQLAVSPSTPEWISIRKSGDSLPRSGTKNKHVEFLDPAKSAALRDKLLAEVADLRSTESAVIWATGALSAKNSLVTADAFEQRLFGLPPPVATDTSAGESAALELAPHGEPKASRAGSDLSTGHRQERPHGCCAAAVP